MKEIKEIIRGDGDSVDSSAEFTNSANVREGGEA